MKTDPEYQAKWLKLVNQYKISNQTMKHFSEIHNVKVYQLQYWIKKYKQRTIDSPISFTEVKVIKPPIIENSIKITYGKLVIELSEHFNEETLLRVLKAVDTLV